jgi:hypothetical protein
MIAEIHLRIAECLVALGRAIEAGEHLQEFWRRRSVFSEEIGDEERLEWARQQLDEVGTEPAG